MTMLTRSYVDSNQLYSLRVRALSELKDRRMTAERLGSFAARHKVKVDDFGAHSSRWVWRFKRGMKERSLWA